MMLDVVTQSLAHDVLALKYIQVFAFWTVVRSAVNLDFSID